MSEYYDEANKLLREWSRNDWRERRDMLADAWSSIPETRRKRILALLMVHAQECDVSEQ